MCLAGGVMLLLAYVPKVELGEFEQEHVTC
jgi:hypothetical protein